MWAIKSEVCFFYVLKIVLMAVILASRSGNCKMDSVVIEFDPYVSILDKENYSRYNTTELRVMIAKVATRFSRIFIELGNEDLNITEKETSRTLSSLATARYNCLHGTSQKLDVWLGMSHGSISTKTSAELNIKQIWSTTKNVNAVCNDTITAVLLPIQDLSQISDINDVLTTEQNKLPHDKTLELGIILKDGSQCEKLITAIKPHIIVFEGNFDYSNVQLVQTLVQHLNQCRSLSENLNHTVSFGVMHSVTDTQIDNTVNTTFLVTSWNEAMEWARVSGNTVILSKAFDTPYKNRATEKTMGWWRLQENPNYTNANDYIFEEKITHAEQVDLLENPMNFEWLKDQITFQSKTTGLIFRRNDVGKRLSYKTKKTFFAHEYLRILLFDDKVFEQFANDGLQKHEGVLMITINISYAEIKEYPQNITSLPNINVYLPFALRNTNIVSEFRKYYTKYSNLRLSYSFSLSMCSSFSQIGTAFGNELLEILSNGQNTTFLFHFKEDPETVKLGARRMFEQRVVLLEQCRQIVMQFRNFNIELGFALLEYPKLQNFDKSPWSLQNFVRYCKLLNDWASSQNNVAIFLQALDRDAYESVSSSLGWWSIEKSQDASSRPKIILLDKRSEALKTSQTPEKQGLISTGNMNLNLVITVAVALCVIAISISLCFIKRHNRNEPLSNEELDQFFHGDDSENVANSENSNRVPYDKEKYEIDEEKYSFDDDSILGAGEFGQVLRGKVELEEGESISVAIKTTNPLTQHVSALKGLLSEVKLLAYIGKHANITELIGANTSNLKRGKILIFLELCHLGSLQKFLREIEIPTRNLMVQPNESVSIDNLAMQYKYTNFRTEGDKIILDSALSKDLFRWSTEICSGMAYLAEKFVVHADLATRNVLINLRKQAKICDFGLSRRMYNYTDYVKSGREPLPWKWMAPESLRFMQFSEKSDVWAFGIMLWEMYTLGETPYQGLSWDVNFSVMLEQGLRPSEPKYNELDMYLVMMDCWKAMADRRPSFASLLKILEAKTTKENEKNI